MAQLALGAAGAFIGSLIAPGIGTSVGWMIGSTLGSTLDAKGTQGPRLTDLKAQIATYGQPIPILYGTIRTSGNIIWQTDLIEHAHQSSGKGGPRNTNYTYTCSFAVLLCEGPIIGIRRIWADSRLIWEGSAAGTESGTLPMTIYRGTDDQLPDPTMEADKGVGNVPAYRRRAYVVFSNLELNEFFNRIPNLTFEVLATGDVSLEIVSQWEVDPNDGVAYGYPQDLAGQDYDPQTGILRQHQWRSGNDYTPLNDSTVYYEQRNYTLQGELIDQDSFSIFYPSLVAFPNILASQNSQHVYTEYQYETQCWEDGPILQLNQGIWTPMSPDLIIPSPCLYIDTNGYLFGIGSPNNSCIFFHQGYLYATGGKLSDLPERGGPGIWIKRWPCNENEEVVTFGPDKVFYLRDTIASMTPYGDVDGGGMITVGDDGFLYSIFGINSSSSNIMLKLTLDLEVVRTWDPLDIEYIPSVGSFTVFMGHILVQANGGATFGDPGIFLYRIEDDDTFTEIDFLRGDVTGPTYDQDFPAWSLPSPTIPLGQGYVAWRGGILNLNAGTTLAAIVRDISERVGLEPEQINVDELTELVRGYAITQQMTGRAAIEPLQNGFIFDGVESDLTMKFLHRIRDPVVTIGNDDLGTHEQGEEPASLHILTHQQDEELPRALYVKYLNADADYQEGAQLWQRQQGQGGTRKENTINLPIVFNDAEAKRTVDILGSLAWLERDKVSFTTHRGFAQYEPTDVVLAAGFELRLTNKHEQANGIIEFKAVRASNAIYAQAAVPGDAVGGFVPPTVEPQQPTELLLLDIALVRDTDLPGFYTAMGGLYRETWKGAELFRSVDDGGSYDSLLRSTVKDTFGTATTVLGDWVGGNIFDEGNSVTVHIGANKGTLASATTLAVLNGANMCLLGSEIVQFKNATLTATSTYVLSGLLRGRRGTEWATWMHYVGERFVLLPVINVESSLGELGVPLLYKAVTLGSSIDSATETPFTNNGEALRPYAPVHVGGGRNAAGDITINWKRRTRIGGAWKDYVDVPLSEASEHYELDFYTDDTYTTIATGASVYDAQTYLFSAADQTATMSGLQDPLYVAVRQFGSYQPSKEARAAI